MIYLFSVNFIVHKKMAEKINQKQQKNESKGSTPLLKPTLPPPTPSPSHPVSCSVRCVVSTPTEEKLFSQMSEQEKDKLADEFIMSHSFSQELCHEPSVTGFEMKSSKEK